jgi:hypothetical protein
MALFSVQSNRLVGGIWAVIHVGLVVHKVALGQGFLRVLRFSRVNIIPPWLSILILSGGRTIGLMVGRSSETQSHPIDMNNLLGFVISKQ